MFNIFKEQLVNLADGHLLPRRPSYRSLHKWGTVGLKGPDGKQVFLEVVKVGREPCTSKEAYSRFCAEMTGEE